MKHNAQPTTGPTPRQRELLERRAQILPIITATLAEASAHGDIEPGKVFTDLFVRLGSPNAGLNGGPIPEAFVRRATRNHIADEVRRQRRRNRAHQTYHLCRPECQTCVADINVDDVDWRKVLRGVKGDSPAAELARCYADSVEAAGRFPTQEELAADLGVDQSTVSRLAPEAQRLLRRAVDSLDL